MSRRLRVGDRVRAVVDGHPCRGDLGVVAESVAVPSGGWRSLVRAERVVVVWDTGHVDDYTRRGVPVSGPPSVRLQLTGAARWWRDRALAEELDHPDDRATCRARRPR